MISLGAEFEDIKSMSHLVAIILLFSTSITFRLFLNFLLNIFDSIRLACPIPAVVTRTLLRRGC